jgi:hypothetical protein
MDGNKMFQTVNTSDISEVLVNPTTITSDVTVKKLLDGLKIIRQESYNAEILRLVRELLEIKMKGVP